MTMSSKFAGTCKACGCYFPAGTSIVWAKGSGAKHAIQAECDAAKAAEAARTARKSAPTTKLDLTSIVAFITAAQQRGLKSPKLRVLDTDNRSELRLGLTRTGRAPGSVSVVRESTYVGGVRPDGTVVGGLAHDTARQTLLTVVAADPAAAAKAYAAIMCRCCFCGLPLTDAGSVQVGYGPVCAKHWGLPHSALGTTVLHPVINPPVQPVLAEDPDDEDIDEVMAMTDEEAEDILKLARLIEARRMAEGVR